VLVEKARVDDGNTKRAAQFSLTTLTVVDQLAPDLSIARRLSVIPCCAAENPG
jgi:hypothetical protein